VERTAPQTHRIAVLTSGHSRGSNLRALHEYFSTQAPEVEIALVVNNRKQAPVWDLCAELGLPCVFISTRDMDAFERVLLAELAARGICLVALAGFMKLLSTNFLSQCAIPVLNIHPALVPKHCGAGMYGMKVHEAVFSAGEKVSGVTIHRVDALYDHGEIVFQASVDISHCRSAEEVAATVLALEHASYAPAIVSCLRGNTPCSG